MPVVDLKFVVHGTGDLKAAAKNLAHINKQKVDRVSNHDFVAAANNRELKATKQLTRYENELINVMLGKLRVKRRLTLNISMGGCLSSGILSYKRT